MIILEAYSVVIRTEAIINNFKGSYNGFLKSLPNRTHCSDRELDRIGFMIWDDLIAYANYIIRHGLKRSRDFTFHHMSEGIVGDNCPWLEFARFPWFEESPVDFTFGWLSPDFGGSQKLVYAIPKGWSPIKSIKSSDLIPEPEKRLQVLKHDQNGMFTYLDKMTGNVVYVGRS